MTEQRKASILTGLMFAISVIIVMTIVLWPEVSAEDYMKRVEEAMTACLDTELYTRDECLPMAIGYAQDRGRQ